MSDPSRRNHRYDIILLTSAVVARVAELVEKYRRGVPNALRSLDGIQLACATLARETLAESERAALVFVTVDRQLLGVARNEGFVVVNPVAPAGA